MTQEDLKELIKIWKQEHEDYLNEREKIASDNVKKGIMTLYCKSQVLSMADDCDDLYNSFKDSVIMKKYELLDNYTKISAIKIYNENTCENIYI